MMNPKPDRTILLIDVDCFEVQVWLQRFPSLKGWPCVTVNPPSRITCVNYPARRYGITRDMPLRVALRKCSSLQVFINDFNAMREVDPWRMANTASWDIRDTVKALLREHGIHRFTFEYLSRDEFFIDISAHVNESPPPDFLDTVNDRGIQVVVEDKYRKMGTGETWCLYSQHSPTMMRLVHGGLIGKLLCDAILERLGYECSVGVATSKLVAKIGCGLNKPFKVTVLPQWSLPRVSPLISLEKVPGLGGLLGKEVAETLNISRMSELGDISPFILQEVFGTADAEKLWRLGKGLDNQAVRAKHMHTCVGCRKFFKDGAEIGVSRAEVETHLLILSFRLVDRLREDRERHKREFPECKLIFNTGRSERNSTFWIFPDMNGDEFYKEARQALARYDEYFGIGKTFYIAEMRLHCKDSINLSVSTPLPFSRCLPTAVRMASPGPSLISESELDEMDSPESSSESSNEGSEHWPNLSPLSSPSLLEVLNSTKIHKAGFLPKPVVRKIYHQIPPAFRFGSGNRSD